MCYNKNLRYIIEYSKVKHHFHVYKTHTKCISIFCFLTDIEWVSSFVYYKLRLDRILCYS